MIVPLVLVLSAIFGTGQTCSTCCVNNASITEAFNVATRSLGVTNLFQTTEMAEAEAAIEIDTLGQVIDEITRFLASKCLVAREDIYRYFASVDLRNTVLAAFCPASFTQRLSCTQERFRSYDGTCNNLNNTFLGSTSTIHRRLLLPKYDDGISIPRSRNVFGSLLPEARTVSEKIHRDLGLQTEDISLYFTFWGQAIDHDMTLTPATTLTTSGSQWGSSRSPCCVNNVKNTRRGCFSIGIDSRDSFYCHDGVRCMPFSRSAAGLRRDCRLGPMEQMNRLTSFLDAGFVYGTSNAEALSLRTCSGGLMKTSYPFSVQGLKPLLPPGPCENCFLAGDVRVNENPGLTIIHTLLVREHNRIAQILSILNEHWEDEKIYQETRHIITALVQKITFDEFLPLMLGRDIMVQLGLQLQLNYFTGYNANVDPSIPNEFAAAAFRFGHSTIPANLERWTNTHRFILGIESLRNLLNKPNLHNLGFADQYIAGLANQAAHVVDAGLVKDLTRHLFQGQLGLGFDLAALNIQRGRDHGIPPYNDYREYCGFPRIMQWCDASAVFSNQTLIQMMAVYQNPEDIDLFTGGVSEIPLPGALVGPTFGCIIAKTFANLRNGDRFWFENSGWPSSFTEAQLREIKKVKLSRIICDNSDNIPTIQLQAMRLASCASNPRISCSLIPSMNLTEWKEALPSVLAKSYSTYTS